MLALLRPWRFGLAILVAAQLVGAALALSTREPSNRRMQRLRGQASADRASLLHYEEGSFHTGNVSHEGGVQTEVVSKGNGTQQPEPRVFFLFLTMSGIERPELWQAFFDHQPEDRWRVLMHCKHFNTCELQLSQSNLLRAKQVPTVHTEYCSDLVSGMVQLLSVAVMESQSSRDKFVFLSESTLPTKPFGEVYNALTWDTNSDFCVYPTDHWVELELAQNLHALVVKHSQ
jgi:hypothetical protein